MRTRTIASMVATAATFVAVIAVSPAWGQTTQTTSPIAATLQWLGASPQTAAGVAGQALMDGRGDTFRYAVPGAEPATLDVAYGDIVAHVASAATLEGFGPDGAPDVPCQDGPAGDTLVLCDSPTVVAAAGPWWLFVAEFAGELPLEDDGLHHSFGVPILRRGGDPWVPQGFDWDTFQGTDLWITLERNPGEPWVFSATEASTFERISTGSFVVVRGTTMAVGVPADVLGYEHPAGDDAAEALRGQRTSDDAVAWVGALQEDDGPRYGIHQHTHDGTFGREQSDASIVDSAPDTNSDERRTPARLAIPGTGIIVLGAPPPEAVPSEAPSPSPSPTATTPTADVTPPPGSDEGGDLFLYGLFVGIAVVGAGVYGATRRRTKLAPCSCRCRVTIDAPDVIETCCADLALSTHDCEDLEPAEDMPDELPTDPSKIHLDLDVKGKGWDFYDLIVSASVEGVCNGGEVLVDQATYDWTVTQFDGGINLRVEVEAPVRCPDGGEHPPVSCYAEKEIVFREGTCRIGVVIQRVDWNEISHVDVVVECGSYREIFGYFPEGARTFSATIAGGPGDVLRARNTVAGGQDRGRPTNEIRDEIGDDFEIYHGSAPLRVYWITPKSCEACAKVREFWENLDANPGNYYLLNNNCALNARASLQAGGLWEHDGGPTVRPGQVETSLDMQQLIGTDGYTIAEEVDIR